MYQACQTFYIISVLLSYTEYQKIINVFTLILESHEIQSNYIINSFKKDFQQLNKKYEMIINDEKIHVCAFIMTFLKNIL